MQSHGKLSRRNLLQGTTSLSAAALMRLGAPALTAITQAACTARQDGSGFLVLGKAEAEDFAAIAARIIPTTETPGATEAGVIHFFDKAFADVMQAELGAARAGLAEINTALAAAGHVGHFSGLNDELQDGALRERENSAFFKLVRDMTIFGFFAMSSYGGNKDQVGWELIGFAGHHGAWSYPFGHYDAEYAAESTDGN
jgi:gluconate 2-dehydrogenase gamma chain